MAQNIHNCLSLSEDFTYIHFAISYMTFQNKLLRDKGNHFKKLMILNGNCSKILEKEVRSKKLRLPRSSCIENQYLKCLKTEH